MTNEKASSDMGRSTDPPGSSGWVGYYTATEGRPPREPLVRAVELLGRPGDALDLGCGAGNDTRYLLARGFRVTAVDADPDSFAARQASDIPNLRTVRSTFGDFSFDPAGYDLISAQFALPFTPPKEFPAVFDRIERALRPGGIFSGDLFGNRDGWNVPRSGMTFHTREEAERLLEGLELLEFHEVEEEGTLATGDMKQWHRFQMIARRPADHDS